MEDQVRQRQIEDHRKLIGGREYCVMAALGDPFVREARARLIWAANTAQAVQNLGLRGLLAASAGGVPIKFEAINGVPSVKRIISSTYNVKADFDICGLFDIPKKLGTMPVGRWALDYEIPRFVFPRASFMHTRDPRILTRALAAGLICVYEDHDEEHNNGFESKLPDLLAKYPNFRLVIAIADAVKDRLISSGIPHDRVLMLDSGVNANSFVRDLSSIERLRRSVRLRGYEHLFVYSGGLQFERGVDHLIILARAFPKALVALFGGNRVDQQRMRQLAMLHGVTNLVVAGYVPQAEAVRFQQSADIVVATRKADDRAAITSPLKFFEYLASGAATVAASIPAISQLDLKGMAVSLYDPARPDSIVSAARELLSKHPWRFNGHSLNQSYAQRYTWEQRQLRLLSALKYGVEMGAI